MRPTCWLVAMRLPGLDDPAELGRLTDHVATCLRCQAEAARYRTLHRRLRALDRVSQPAPEGLVAAVMSRLGQPVAAVAATRRSLVRTRAAVAAAVTGAAVVATAGTLALLLRRLNAPV